MPTFLLWQGLFLLRLRRKVWWSVAIQFCGYYLTISKKKHQPPFLTSRKQGILVSEKWTKILGHNKSDILFFHSFLGCDTTSRLHSFGKPVGFTLVKCHKCFYEVLQCSIKIKYGQMNWWKLEICHCSDFVRMKCAFFLRHRFFVNKISIYFIIPERLPTTPSAANTFIGRSWILTLASNDVYDPHQSVCLVSPGADAIRFFKQRDSCIKGLGCDAHPTGSENCTSVVEEKQSHDDCESEAEL